MVGIIKKYLAILLFSLMNMVPLWKGVAIVDQELVGQVTASWYGDMVKRMEQERLDEIKSKGKISICNITGN